MKYIPMILIVLLGFVLRFAYLGEVPLSMHRDEAFLGYNAYSILKTGKDISGALLPLHLESFFMSPSGYSYFAIPSLRLFGLSDFAVRFPAAFFGALTIPMLYFLSRALFKESKRKDTIAFLAAFLLAISPWHINLSRVATENTLVTFFVVVGVYLYLSYIKSGKRALAVLSFFALSITLILYQAPRAFLPIFVPVLLYSFNNSKKILKFRIEYLLFGLLIILPVILILTSRDLSWRITSLSIFSHEETKLVLNEQLTTDSVQGLPYLLSRIFHNKIVAFGLLISENFFKHLSFDFLFQDGGFPDRYRIPKMGLLHLFELPLLLLGLYLLVKRNLRIAVFLILWIVFGIFGSALTSDDVPNLQRILLVLPAFCIISAYGGLTILEYLKGKKRSIKIVLGFIAGAVIVFSLGYYIVQYYFQGKVYRTWYRQDGYEQMVLKVNENLNNFNYAVITDRESTPAVFFMYHGNYDPKTLQNETKSLDMRGAGDIPFGKYRFTDEECPVRYEMNDTGEEILIGEKGILYVNSGLCKIIPREARIIDTIKRADNSTAFILLTL